MNTHASTRRLRGFIPAIAIAIGCLPCPPVRAQAPAETDTDVVCETLMADYILKQGKIDTASIEAAIELVASRGRRGYWRTVHQYFKVSPVDAGNTPSLYLLKILTKMLAVDGQARWLEAHPEELRRRAGAWNVVLPSEVLDTIMTRARTTDRNQLDAYVVAVVAAHDPRAKDFLRDVLRAQRENPDAPFGDAKPGTLPIDGSAKFHAAVGLAELGEREGVAWLVESSGDMLQSQLHALADLTGRPVGTLEDWQAWWKTNPVGDRFEPKSRVRLRR